MTNTITLPIETEEFKTLLKSIQTRLNNLDDKKPTPIIKKKMPFIPNMLVSKMIMMARPTYPYIQEIKDMVKELDTIKNTKITFKRHARTGKSVFPMWKKYNEDKMNWFEEYHYLKHYNSINNYFNGGGYDEMCDIIMTDLVGHDYEWDTEQIYIMKKCGLGFQEENKRGYAKEYGKSKLAGSINEWLLDGKKGRSNFKAYSNFLDIVKSHIQRVFDVYHRIGSRSWRTGGEDTINYREEKHTKKTPFFFNFKAPYFPLNVEFYWLNGKIYLQKLKAHGENYYSFHD